MDADELLTAPGGYSTPGYAPLKPGADWIIDGHRFRVLQIVREES